jgi:hypothetical protein
MYLKFGLSEVETEVAVRGVCSALVVLGSDPARVDAALVRHSQFHGVVEDLVEFVGLPPDVS